ncbi:hypothetical protein ACFOLF_24845 [Paenibacillus sepulcri]|uniref:Uncharacterized protein n=1 Tax=Paenibacillus sepulcri TaxID=359917 RepID=A0ABS7C2K3_9BACL|nr:hypothetical protein [Paenibacillus sepulcri]
MIKQFMFPMIAMVFVIAGILFMLQDYKSIGAVLMIVGICFNVVGMIIRNRRAKGG